MFGGIKRNATDILFSEYIRAKALWKCERCFRDFSTRKAILDCSHFFGRRGKSTRWDPENAASICRGCHKYFSENPADHVRFFEKRLGPEKFAALVLRAKTPVKYQDEMAIRRGLREALK